MMSQHSPLGLRHLLAAAVQIRWTHRAGIDQSGSQERRDARLKLGALADDRTAPAEEWRRLAVPPGLGTREKVGIPYGARRVGDLPREPVAHQLLLIPEVDYSRVRQAAAVPPCSAVAEQHVEPDRVDAQVSGRILVEYVLLHPTGAGTTGRSSRGHQQDDSGIAYVLVEPRLQLADALQVPQAASRLRCWLSG